MLARAAALWVPAAAAITIMAGVTYAALQQDLRLGADDPQLQLAHDAADRLAGGTQPGQVVPGGPLVDPHRSLAPFVAVYDRNLQPVASSAQSLSVPPAGVFESARSSGENRRTWQPDTVRIAAVVVPYRDGYVLAGRSLLEVERRERMILSLIAVGWLAALAAAAAAALAAAQLLGRKVSIKLG